MLHICYVEYNEDNLIIKNNTRWDRGIFSDYKKFELKDLKNNLAITKNDKIVGIITYTDLMTQLIK